VRTQTDLVVLAGGSGARLWPLSRSFAPKHLLRLSGTNSLVADTVSSITHIAGLDVRSTTVLTNERFADEISNALSADVGWTGVEVHVVAEPLGRGPSFAAMLALAELEQRHVPAAQAVLLPSHIAMKDSAEWSDAVSEAIRLGAEDTPVLLRFSGAHAGESISSYGFVGYPSALADALTTSADAAETYRVCSQVAQHPVRDWTRDEVRNLVAPLPTLDLEAVVTASADMVTVDAPAPDVQLHDLSALREVAEPDSRGNVRTSRGVDHDSQDSLIYGGERLVATLGVRDVSIVDTADALLVADNDSLPNVRKITEALAVAGAEELTYPRESRRPWGSWATVAKGPAFHIKTIRVTPGRRLSLQSHQRRAEHWIVVRGEATVESDGTVSVLSPGSSTFVPAGAVHRLSNEHSEELEVIEVQVGDYLGEDDIVRHEDDFSRF
jgi:mannose-1-phosphate guanylyltransferase/mannose-6-phosphate isomerase-like protein (cupin superfamily)